MDYIGDHNSSLPRSAGPAGPAGPGRALAGVVVRGPSVDGRILRLMKGVIASTRHESDTRHTARPQSG